MEGKKIFVRADLPADREDRKDLVTNGLEAGIVSYILRKGDESFEDLGKMEDVIYFENGQPVSDDVMFSSIDTPEAQDKVLSMVGKKKTIIVETGDWTIIPLENMIAKFRSAGTRVMAVASKKEEAELYLTTMEKGVDGIVIDVKDPPMVRKFGDRLSATGKETLSEVEIVSV